MATKTKRLPPTTGNDGNGAAVVGSNATVTLAIVRPIIRIVEMEIIGTTPYVAHQFAQKAIRAMEDKQQKKAKSAPLARVPRDDFEGARYLDERGRDCIPGAAFKRAAVRGAKHSDLVMKDALSSFFVTGHLVPITFEGETGADGKVTPVMRTDPVRIGGPGGTMTMAYRPEYRNWKATLLIELNTNLLSLDQLVACFEAAGFGVGVGEMRPEKCGDTFGRFRVGEVRVR